MGCILFVLGIIRKVCRVVLKIVFRVLVWTGLWVPAVFCGVFFLWSWLDGKTFADVSLYFYIFFPVSIVLGLMWFAGITVGRRRSKDKGGKGSTDSKSSELPGSTDKK